MNVILNVIVISEKKTVHIKVELETDLNNYLKLSNETLECLNDRFSELIVALSWETPVLLTS